jgi:hypothetical protein
MWVMKPARTRSWRPVSRSRASRPVCRNALGYFLTMTRSPGAGATSSLIRVGVVGGAGSGVSGWSGRSAAAVHVRHRRRRESLAELVDRKPVRLGRPRPVAGYRRDRPAQGGGGRAVGRRGRPDFPQAFLMDARGQVWRHGWHGSGWSWTNHGAPPGIGRKAGLGAVMIEDGDPRRSPGRRTSSPSTGWRTSSPR